MRAVRGFLCDFNVYRWAGKMTAGEAALAPQSCGVDDATDHLARVAAKAPQ